MLTCAHLRAQQVVGVQTATTLQVVGVVVGLVLITWLLAAAPVLDEEVKKLLEQLLQLLVACHRAHDEEVIQVVHSSLMTLSNMKPLDRCTARGSAPWHLVVVAAEVGVHVLCPPGSTASVPCGCWRRAWLQAAGWQQGAWCFCSSWGISGKQPSLF